MLKYLISEEGKVVMLTLDKYVDLNEKYASYNNDGYYIDPIIILVMIADNLHYGLSFSELKEFVKEVDLVISKEKLDAFLDQKVEPGYTKDSCTLDYFKNYLDRRKKKCATLFDIYEDIESVRNNRELTSESIDRLHQLDFHFNKAGYVYYEDALRLAETIIFNVNDLYEKGDLANRLETYLDFKITREDLEENQEIYPRVEVQLLDSKYIGTAEFLPLSQNQRVEYSKRNRSKQKRK